MIRATHVTGPVSRLAGGLFESVRFLSRNVQGTGRVEVTVLGLEDRLAGVDAGKWAPVGVERHRTVGPAGFGYAPGLGRALAGGKAEVVHLHGLWRYGSVAVNRWFGATGRPYVVSPHGMLEPWALGQGRFKKALARVVYQDQCLRRAACLRATSWLECESIRQAGYGNAVAVIPNGIQRPRGIWRRWEHGLGRTGKRRALFLSRVHPKKGLVNLVRAWGRVRPAGWELAVVGPDEGGHLAEVKQAARAEGVEGEIVFAGEAWGEARERFYAGSDLFVLPSMSENFGLVIGEALARGVPVITTQATPWRELAERGCGWWIKTGLEPLVEALREATAAPAGRLREMGERGRQLVEARYRWEMVGEQMAEVYEWLLGRAGRPGWVEVG